jgi:TRAP-type C4-dicarboxylate transport system permease large subunit
MDIPADAVAAVYEQTISRMRQSTAAVLLVGVFTALLAGLVSSARIRRAMIALNVRVRSVARVEQWAHQRWRGVLRQQRVVLRGAIIALAVAVIVLGSLHAGGITLTVVLSLVAWWVLAILEAQPGDIERAPAEPTTT